MLWPWTLLVKIKVTTRSHSSISTSFLENHRETAHCIPPRSTSISPVLHTQFLLDGTLNRASRFYQIFVISATTLTISRESNRSHAIFISGCFLTEPHYLVTFHTTELPIFRLTTRPSSSSERRRVYAVRRVHPTFSATSDVPPSPSSSLMASIKAVSE